MQRRRIFLASALACLAWQGRAEPARPELAALRRCRMRNLRPCSLASGSMAAPAALTACAGTPARDASQDKPALDLRTDFNGTVDAWGIFTDRSGQVVKRFTVVMDCRWQGDDGVLDEAFTYSDGSAQRRIWRLQAGPEGRYMGHADDVVGEATLAFQRRTPLQDPP